MLAFPFYLACAAAALFVARRCVSAIPLRVCVVLVLLPLVFTGRALLTGGVFGPIDLAYDSEPLASVAAEHGVSEMVNPMLTDVQRLMIPWKVAVRYAFAHRQWPLLNPFAFCGDILAAGSEPSPWHPFNALSYLLPLAQSITFHASLAFFAAGVVAFLFAKELGVADLAALFAAVAWMFSAFLMFFIQVPLGAAVLMLPLVLLAVSRVVARPAFHSMVLLAVTLALVVVAGHPESLLHVVAIGVAYGVFELAALRDRQAVVRAVGAAVAAGAVALLLSAIHLLPFIEALPQTADYQFRVERSVSEAAQVGWRETASRVVGAAVPFRFGSPVAETAHVPSRYHRPIYGYAGSLLFVPALAGIFRTRHRIRWFLIALLITGVLASVSAPIVTAVLKHVPLFNIAINERLVIGAVLALAMLGALGIDAMLRDGANAMLWCAIGVLVVLAATIFALWPAMLTDGLSSAYLRANTLRELVPLMLCVALLLARRSARSAAVGLIALLLLQRTIEERRTIPTYPASALYPRTPLLDALPKSSTPYRVAGREATLLPNIATHYELEDARGATGMTFARMAETLPLWSRLEPVSFNHIEDLSRPFLSALNVRYAFAETRDPLPAGWVVRAEYRGARLLENPRALERAFIPRRVTFAKDDLHALTRIADFRDEATVTAPNDGTIVNGSGRVATTRDGLDFHLDAQLASNAWIIVSETAWKGWRATIDGRDAPLSFGNHAFLAVRVPAGHHEVMLRYRPRSFFIGLALTLMTLIALVVVRR